MAQILRALPAMPLVLLISLYVADSVRAHNNPTFREELVLTVEVAAAPLSPAGPTHSEPFTLELPKGTIELIWRIKAPAEEGISFSVAQAGVVVADGLEDGAVSTLIRGEDLAIVDVTGADAPFILEIYANLIDRSARTASG